jgi:murein DD-endopeptidase MepM/ murein hydrolase activator NlpD
MRKLKKFNLLIVAEDSTRVLRLKVPRWVLYGGLIVLVVGASTLGVLATDYLFLKEQRASMADLRTKVTEQQALIDTFQRRIAEIRSEVGGWRDLHTKIWEPFGPVDSGNQKGTGIGGRTASEPNPPLTERGTIFGDLDFLAASVNEEGQSLRALERYFSRVGKVLAALPSRWPVRGPVNSEFGTRVSPWSGRPEFHGGIDIAAERGTPVKAPASGEVAFVGNQSEYGLTIVIDHGNDIKTLYGHLQKVLVTKGQKVERGQLIALTGMTGKTSGPHLHYEIALKGQPVNPRRYLWE